MENQLEIYKRLAAINKAINPITKSRVNQQQNFKFRGIDEVMNELHSIFSENEVLIIPKVVDFKREERTNKNGTVLFYTHLTVSFTFTTIDGSSVEATSIGEAMDSGDKGTNKAMSIALKYVLLQMFLIPTEEDKDPDAQSHEVKPTEHRPTNYTIEMALEEMLNNTDLNQVQLTWSKYKLFQKNDEFIRVKEEMKNKFKTV